MSDSWMSKKVIVGAALAVALSAGVAWSTPGFGTTSVLLGRGTFSDPVKVKRAAHAYGWKVEVEAEPNLDVAVQSIDVAAGAHSGWHSHWLTVGDRQGPELPPPSCRLQMQRSGNAAHTEHAAVR